MTHVQSPARLEGRQKVTGTARYTSDVEFSGQLYAGVLRSPHGHARVVKVDSEAVRNIPGVRDVITRTEAGEVNWYEEQVPLFGDVVRFVGEEIAAVAADSEEAVEDALRAFKVEYQPLEAITSIDQASRDGAIEVHKGVARNVAVGPEVYTRGDPERGFAEAEVVVEATYTTQTALHNALEPHGCNAWWDGDVLNLWVSTQGIFAVREGIANKLGLPLNKVRVHTQHVGGAFGAKQIDWKETAVAALLAKRTGRPVRLMLDREAENLAVGNRSNTRQKVKLGATRDGRLCAISAIIDINGGAYRIPGEGSIVAGCYQGLYACTHVHTEQTRYYTNTGPSVAFRAPGYVEGTFALEQAMDELARKLELDPFELRERNYTREAQSDDLPYSAPDGLRHCYAAARETFAWPPQREMDNKDPRKRRGFGMAASVWLAGGSNPPAYANAILQPDGTLSVQTGTQDIGTGTRTALAQVAAEALDMPLDAITLELGDTGSELKSPPSAGSATLASMGPAVRNAVAPIKARLLELASQRLNIPVERLQIKQGKVQGDSGGEAGIKVAELAAGVPPGSLHGHGSCPAKPDDVALHTFAVSCAEVEVDLHTGEISVLRLVCAPECGRIINHRLAESQVIGGVTQGLGFALTEERIVDPAGFVLNANLEDYLVPTVMDIPQIEHAVVDEPDYAANELGVKGLGEPPMIAVAPAIANAVHDATGLRIRDLPIKRKRLLQALAATGGQA